MIKRDLSAGLQEVSKTFRVVALLGPRQSGKTTLAQITFPQHRYVSLEDLDTRDFAKRDPRGFLASLDNTFGIILDEIQHVPELLSYIQTQVDREKKPGYFILTGSQNFLVNKAITQTLAGRMAILTLLPFSIQELKEAKLLPDKVEQLMFKGGYPPVYTEEHKHAVWFSGYKHGYIERDVRDLTQVHDLATFMHFMELCAGRVGQLLNLTSLSNDCGISVNTVKSWLSILEASYIIFLLRPYHANLGKQLTKMPKLYFYDTGLAASLLKIESPEQLMSHYARGGLMESLMISDIYKTAYNELREPHIFFWRDTFGHEIDCLIERAGKLFPIEIKSGMTIHADFFDNLEYFCTATKTPANQAFLVYTGTERQHRSLGQVLPWFDIPEIPSTSK